MTCEIVSRFEAGLLIRIVLEVLQHWIQSMFNGLDRRAPDFGQVFQSVLLSKPSEEAAVPNPLRICFVAIRFVDFRTESLDCHACLDWVFYDPDWIVARTQLYHGYRISHFYFLKRQRLRKRNTVRGHINDGISSGREG